MLRCAVLSLAMLHSCACRVLRLCCQLMQAWAAASAHAVQFFGPARCICTSKQQRCTCQTTLQIDQYATVDTNSIMVTYKGR